MRYRSAIVEEHARLDVAVSGLWGSRFERTCAVGKWWHGKSGDITLSPNRVIESGKEEGAVLPRNILHQMPSLICPVAIIHHVFAGFTGSFP